MWFLWRSCEKFMDYCLTAELSIGILYKMIFKIVNLGDMKTTIANSCVENIPNSYSAWEVSRILPINSNSSISKASRKQHENW